MEVVAQLSQMYHCLKLSCIIFFPLIISLSILWFKLLSLQRQMDLCYIFLTINKLMMGQKYLRRFQIDELTDKNARIALIKSD